jgi:hypothetical protein
VWKRDGGQCAFVGKDGRCTERGFLEFHHVTPYATGGPTTVENLQLRCRAHNAYESEQTFGSMWVREGRGGDGWTVQLGPDRAGGSDTFGLLSKSSVVGQFGPASISARTALIRFSI